VEQHKRGRRGVSAFDVAVALFGAVLVVMVAANSAAIVRATFAMGEPGVFSAQRVRCVQHLAHESCEWEGDFRPGDGGAVRAGVGFYGAGRDDLAVGQQVAAVDTGRANRVYPVDGSNEWLFALATLACGAALVSYPFHPLRRLRAARAARH